MYLSTHVLDALREAAESINPHFAIPSVIWGLLTAAVWLWCWGGRFQKWKDRDRTQEPDKVIGRPPNDTRLQEQKVRNARRRRDIEFLRVEIGYLSMVWAPISLIFSIVLFLGIWEDPPLELISGIAGRNAWLAGFAGIQIFGDFTLSRM